MYVIGHDGKKTPIQIKNSSNGNGYGRKVLVVRHYDIFRPFRETVATSSVYGPETRISDCLQVERKGGYGREKSSSALNLATMYVVSRIEKFKRESL